MHTLSRKELIQELLKNFQIIKKQFNKASCTHESDLTHAQWLALIIIHGNEPLNLKNLAQHLSVTQSAATQLIDALEQKGHVTRTLAKADQREQLLTLSKSTQKHIKEIKAEKMVQFETLFAPLTDEELTIFCTLQKKITNALS